MILVNGEAQGSVAITDRGFQYGDGLFETIAVLRQKPVFLNQHLDRLLAGCRKLNIPSPDRHTLVTEALTLCDGANSAVLKIIITRGSGGRGYRQPDDILATRVLSLHPFPEYPLDYWHLGINARFCQTRLGLNPTLAGVKHLNRLEQVMARAEWQDNTIQEGIMQDIDGNVIEGTMTNIFCVKNTQLLTPALTHSGVAGIIRGLVFGLATRNNLNAIETTISKDDLLSAEEIFVSNSIIGIWPIRHLENKSFPVGKVTKQIQTWLHECQNEPSRSTL